MADPTTTYDDKNLPISNGIQDLLEKTGKIQNQSLGQQVLSNNQINSMIDATKLNLPAVQGSSFSGYSFLSPTEQAFMNSQSQNQANQFNTLQSQVLLANSRANANTLAQTQNLKTSIGQFYDSSGVNENNSTLGLAVGNNANNIGQEQLRMNNQEFQNQLSQGLNQYQAGQNQLLGQATQLSQTNRSYERQVAESDRSYNTNATGNVNIIGADGKATTMVDSSGNPVYTYGKLTSERGYQDNKDNQMTQLFGSLYKNNKPVMGADGKPVQTLQGRAALSNLQGNAINNATGLLNVNKIAAMQKDDIQTAFVKNALERKNANLLSAQVNEKLAEMDKSKNSSNNSNNSNTPANPYGALPVNPDNVSKMQLNPDDLNAISGKKKNDGTAYTGNEIASAFDKIQKGKATFGSGFGTLFTVESTLGKPTGSGLSLLTPKILTIKSAGNISKTGLVLGVDPFNLEAFNEVSGFENSADALKQMKTAKDSYEANVKTALTNGEGFASQIPKLIFTSYSKNSAGQEDASQPLKQIIGLSVSNDASEWSPNKGSKYAFLQVDESKIPADKRDEYRKEYNEIVNLKFDGKGKPINTTKAVYDTFLENWNTKAPGLLEKIMPTDVMNKLQEGGFNGIGAKTAGMSNTDLASYAISSGMGLNLGAIIKPLKPGEPVDTSNIEKYLSPDTSSVNSILSVNKLINTLAFISPAYFKTAYDVAKDLNNVNNTEGKYKTIASAFDKIDKESKLTGEGENKKISDNAKYLMVEISNFFKNGAIPITNTNTDGDDAYKTYYKNVRTDLGNTFIDDNKQGIRSDFKESRDSFVKMLNKGDLKPEFILPGIRSLNISGNKNLDTYMGSVVSGLMGNYQHYDNNQNSVQNTQQPKQATQNSSQNTTGFTDKNSPLYSQRFTNTDSPLYNERLTNPESPLYRK